MGRSDDAMNEFQPTKTILKQSQQPHQTATKTFVVHPKVLSVMLKHFKTKEFIVSLAYLIYSATSTWTTPFREQRWTWSQLGRGYLPSLMKFQSGLVALDRAITLIFQTWWSFQNMATHCHWNKIKKHLQVLRPSIHGYFQPVKVSASQGWMQDTFIFNLESMDDSDGIKIQLKWKLVEN